MSGMGFFDLGGLMQGIASFHDSTLNTVGLGYNIANQEWNKDQQTANKNWAFADSRAATAMMNYYLKYGSLDGFDTNALSQDYNDVADYLNPFLSLSSLDLSQKSQELAEKQFAYSKYTTENAAQIRMNDLKKAGLSPLLATGNTASYSPVGTGSSGPAGNTSKNRPGYNNLASLSFQSNLAQAVAQLRLTNAQVDNINADTSLKYAMEKTEAVRPDLIGSQVSNTNADTRNKIKTYELINEQIQKTFYETGLTKNQTEYFAYKISELAYNLDLSQKQGISTHDSMSVFIKEVKGIISSMGIDLNSTAGQIALGTGVAIGTGVGAYSVIKGSGKKFLSKGNKLSKKLSKGNKLSKK